MTPEIFPNWEEFFLRKRCDFYICSSELWVGASQVDCVFLLSNVYLWICVCTEVGFIETFETRAGVNHASSDRWRKAEVDVWVQVLCMLKGHCRVSPWRVIVESQKASKTKVQQNRRSANKDKASKHMPLSEIPDESAYGCRKLEQHNRSLGVCV